MNTGSSFPVIARNSDPSAVSIHSRAVEVISVIGVGVEQHVLVEPYGHGLRHSLLLGQSLLHQDLQLYSRAERGDGRKQIFRYESVREHVVARDVTLHVRGGVAEDVLLEERGDLHYGVHLALAHQTLSLVYVGYLVPHFGFGRGVDHVGQLAREHAVVLVEHGDGQIVRYARFEYCGEEEERHDRQHREQHEIGFVGPYPLHLASHDRIYVAQRSHCP